MMRSGGFCASIVRICTGEVWVRSTRREPSGPRRQIERVVLLARRVLGRDVERGEIVEILLDMRPLGDDEPHLAEDRDDLVDRLADRVDAAGLDAPGRPGDTGKVTSARSPVEPVRQRGAAQPVAGLGQRRRDPVAERVQPRAGVAALVGRQLAEAAHRRGDRAVAAEQPDADLFERVGRVRGRDLGEVGFCLRSRVVDLGV